MSTPGTRCPKCDGEMVLGFLVDFSHGDRRRVGSWVEGPPKASFWGGAKAPDKSQVPVGTFRCSKCGYLESFARPEFAVQ